MTRCSHSGIRWATCIEAGCVYALTVFTIGFALGTIRVLLLVPRLGATTAVLLEVPLMLAVSWKMSRRSAKNFGLLSDANAALLMGAIAFVILIFAELGTAMLFFHCTVGQYLASFWSAPGAIGLAAQFCFASFPFLQANRNRIPSSG